MKFQTVIIIVLFVFSMLMIISIVKTVINTKKVNTILAYLNEKHFVRFYGKNCYYSAIGFKKHYPGYPCKLEIYLTDNEIIFIGKNNFSFLFKTIENPFILSKNPNEVRKNTGLTRIFKPDKVYLNGKILNINFTDTITFNTVIDYQIELEDSEHLDKLTKISDWI